MCGVSIESRVPVIASRTFWPASRIGEGETLGSIKAAATSSRAPESGILLVLDCSLYLISISFMFGVCSRILVIAR